MPQTLSQQCLYTIPQETFVELLEKTRTINTFCHKIEDLCNTTTLEPEQFKGDILELFTEYLIKNRGADNRIGINEYKLISETGNRDLGVDGVGIGANGNPATVQVKYRHSDYTLTNNEDHLSNFLTQSWVVFNVNIQDTKNMLIVTTAKDINPVVEQEMLYGKVRTLNRNDLRHLVDNDEYFWQDFLTSIQTSATVLPTENTVIKLRQHQIAAIDEIMKDVDGIGKIILPTGTGKTIIEAETIVKHLTSTNNPQVIKVYGSRILLCFQLMKDIQNYLLNKGIDVDLVNFNSGNQDDTYYTKRYVESGFIGRKVPSTTNRKELLKIVNKSIRQSRSIIIFSTYHSAENSHHNRINVNLSIFDEAHNAVNEEFRNAVDLPSEKKLFFTATPKLTESDEGFGMNNEDRFGNVIFQQSPKQMIDAGEICRPFIHVVKTTIERPSALNDCYDAIAHSIFSAFFAHERKIKSDSKDPSKIGAKVIAGIEGQNILKCVMESNEMQQYSSEYPNIHIGALSSEFGIYWDGEHTPNVTNVQKNAFLENIRLLGNNESCIVLHVDMIGEGIDVPGITGVMPFRNQNVIKFVQFLGRSMRLHVIDKKKFYDGEIDPSNLADYIKPRAWIIIPDFLQNSSDFGERYKTIVKNMKYHYGFNPSEHIIYEDHNGLNDEYDMETVNNLNDNNVFTRTGMINYTHELESVEDDYMIQGMVNEIIELINEKFEQTGVYDYSILNDYLTALN